MTTALLTHQAAETLLRAAPRAQLGQQAGEALIQSAPRARLTGQALELLRSVGEVADAIQRRPVLCCRMSSLYAACPLPSAIDRPHRSV
jgi:hypothetical protein